MVPPVGTGCASVRGCRPSRVGDMAVPPDNALERTIKFFASRARSINHTYSKAGLKLDSISRHCWNRRPGCTACLLLETKWDRVWPRLRKSHRSAYWCSEERISHTSHPRRFRFTPRSPGVSREIEAGTGPGQCGTGSPTGQRHRTDGSALWQTRNGRQGKARCGEAGLGL